MRVGGPRGSGRASLPHWCDIVPSRRGIRA